MLSGMTSSGSIWHFPTRHALRVELETKTSIFELLQPLLNPSSIHPYLFLKVVSLHQRHTHSLHTLLHASVHPGSWWPCSSCREERNRSSQPQVLCVCACVCGWRGCNRCLIFVPFAPDSSMYDNLHVIRERERNGCLGNFTWHPICWAIFILYLTQAFICWGKLHHHIGVSELAWKITLHFM